MVTSYLLAKGMYEVHIHLVDVNSETGALVVHINKHVKGRKYEQMSPQAAMCYLRTLKFMDYKEVE